MFAAAQAFSENNWVTADVGDMTTLPLFEPFISQENHYFLKDSDVFSELLSIDDEGIPDVPLPPSRARVLSLTHFLPFTAHLHCDGSWELRPRLGHAAMYAGISSLLDHHPHSLQIGLLDQIYRVVSIKTSNEDVEIDTKNSEEIGITAQDLNSLEFKELELTLLANACVAVWPTEEEAQRHYVGYCKKALWPLLHYRVWDTATNGREELEDWYAYQRVCKLFADKCAELYHPLDIGLLFIFTFSSPTL